MVVHLGLQFPQDPVSGLQLLAQFSTLPSGHIVVESSQETPSQIGHIGVQVPHLPV